MQSALLILAIEAGMLAPKLSVLIVEDHRDMREALGVYLEILGYRVEYAADATCALALAQTREFNVLLFDIELPDRDGWELLGELQAQELVPPVTVSMSAYLGCQEHKHSKEVGCYAHLTKPFRVEDLEEALRGGI